MGIFKDIKNLLIGMKITSKHLTRHAVTVQYPEQKDKIPEISRGIVILLSDKETGKLNCTACELCMKVCPTAAIKIDAPRGEDKKKHLKSFVVHNALCCYCGLCQDVCNFAAIKMAPFYELSTLDKGDLVWDMDKLQEMGRDVPYTPIPKKKKKPVVKKPAVAKPDAKAEKPEGAKAETPAEAPAVIEKPVADVKEETKPETAPATEPVPQKPADTEKKTEKPSEEPPQKNEGEV